MNQLSILQSYVVCAVNEKGRISESDTNKSVCVVAAGLLEMQIEKIIVIEDKKVRVTNELPADKEYLRPLYEFINQGKPMKLNKIVESYTITFSGKNMKNLMESVGKSLEEKDMAESVKSGLFGGKQGYVPSNQALNDILNSIRTGVKESNTIDDKVAALIILLDNGKCMKKHFTKDEQKEMKSVINDIKNSPEGKMVKGLSEYVEMLLTMIVVTACV